MEPYFKRDILYIISLFDSAFQSLLYNLLCSNKKQKFPEIYRVHKGGNKLAVPN